eukprot:tig00021179_g19236.t1
MAGSAGAAGGKKRRQPASSSKASKKKAAAAPKGRKQPSKKADEALESDEESVLSAEQENGRGAEASSSEEDEPTRETADEKRLRLAKQYLKKLEEEEGAGGADAAVIDKEIISQRLKQDALEASGRLQRKVAARLEGVAIAESSIRSYRGHELPVTCVALTDDDRTAFTGSKDCCVVKWDVETGKRTRYVGSRKGDSAKGHTAQVLAVAVSGDGRYVASGGADKLVRIWDTRTDALVESFQGHRDTVSGLAFRKGSRQLFSSSFDRTVKIWNLDEMAYVETLFGHQAPVMGIDSLHKERAVTAGGMDHTARVWKVVEETQLVFRGHPSSMDCIAMLAEDAFVTGCQDGSLCYWGTHKKKPLVTIAQAHGPGELSAEGAGPGPPWISAVAACPQTDLVASGSSDGFLRVWRAPLGDASPKPAMPQVATVPMPGVVNGIAFARSARFLVAGVGQEHRLGRWQVVRGGGSKNGIRIVPLPEAVWHDI